MGEQAGKRSAKAGAAGSRRPGRRARPLVSSDAVRRWARTANIEVPDGTLDPKLVDLYLARTRTVPHAPGMVIELAARSNQPRKSMDPAPGVPGFGPPPCPDCGAPGYLDHIDLTHGSQSNHCRVCGRRWDSALVTV